MGEKNIAVIGIWGGALYRSLSLRGSRRQHCCCKLVASLLTPPHLAIKSDTALATDEASMASGGFTQVD